MTEHEKKEKGDEGWSTSCISSSRLNPWKQSRQRLLPPRPFGAALVITQAIGDREAIGGEAIGDCGTDSAGIIASPLFASFCHPCRLSPRTRHTTCRLPGRTGTRPHASWPCPARTATASGWWSRSSTLADRVSAGVRSLLFPLSLALPWGWSMRRCWRA